MATKKAVVKEETLEKEVAPLKDNANSEFEEWKIEAIKDKDAEGGYTYDKVKHIKDVRIPEETAERLNIQSMNSKLRYYKK